MRPILHLVVARLTGRRRAGTLMIPLAVAGAVAVLLGSGVVSLVGQDATLRRALERAAPADRTVRVEVFKVGSTQLGRDGGSFAVTAEEERLVRGALPREAGRGPVGEGVLFSELG